MECKQRGNPTIVDHLTDWGFYDDAANTDITNSVLAPLRRSDGGMVESGAPAAPAGGAMVNEIAAMAVDCEEI